MSTVANAASLFSPSQVNTATSNSSTAQATGNTAAQQLAGNFNTFLQLLTTQLQNQNPLDPLDTNQFTQQLVEFASVEQQINTNTNLQSLINLQQTSEATSALQLVGSTVSVNGTPAQWTLTTSTPATANVTVTSSAGTTVYSGTVSLNAGTQSFTWSGQGNNGQTWPDGTYKLSVTATGASGQAVNVSTKVQGVVSAVNLSSNPPTLTVNGQSVQINQVTSITH
jgi:flagellar basal-body rod modification protein FlgD